METLRASYVETSMLKVELLQWEAHKAQCIRPVAGNGDGVLGSPRSSPCTLWSAGLQVFLQGPVNLAPRCSEELEV